MVDRPDAPEAGPQLADHVAASVDAIANFHQEHYRSASGLQRAFDAATERLGRPLFVAFVVLGIVAWVVVAAFHAGRDVADPVFGWLELTATVAALAVAMLILVTQQRQDRLSERRAQLTLELAMLADRKSAKIIALLEELRHDAPSLRNRHDAESAEMATPADPNSVLKALDAKAVGPGDKAAAKPPSRRAS